MKSKSSKLLDLVLTFDIRNDRALVLANGGDTASLFGSNVNSHVPPCLAVWRVDEHESSFSSYGGEVLMAADEVVVSRDGEVIDIYFLD